MTRGGVYLSIVGLGSKEENKKHSLTYDVQQLCMKTNQSNQSNQYKIVESKQVEGNVIGTTTT